MNDKLITALLAILLALGGWTLQRTFSLSQDMVLIKEQVQDIEHDLKHAKKKSRKKKKKQGDQMDEVPDIFSYNHLVSTFYCGM